MAWSPAAAFVVLCGAAAFLGILAGAESQHEGFLAPDPAAQERELREGASGTLIPLTGLAVAVSAGAAGIALSRAAWRRRLAGFALVAAGTWLLVLCFQLAWPSYAAYEEGRTAALSINLFAVNEPAVASVWVPFFAIALAALLAVGLGARRLLGPPAPAASPEAILGRSVAVACVAVPFLAVAFWGCLRLVAGIPDARAGLTPYLVILPCAALICLGLAATQAARLWSVAAFVRNGRLAGATQETLGTVARAELALAGALAGLAVLAAFFPAAQVEGLQAGTTFGVTLRSHTQFLAFALVPLAPVAALHRATLRGLEAHRGHVRTLETGGAHPVAVTALAGLGLSFGLAGAATFAADGSLIPWLAALLPAAAVAAWAGRPGEAAPSLLLAAAVAWALGNGVRATFDEPAGDALLHFAPGAGPGALALWRTLGALVAAVALARLALAAAPRRAGPAAPLAAGLGAAVAVVALVELALAAWVVNGPSGTSLAVGSLVASLDAPVRGLLHTVAGLACASGSYAIAYLARPDWFGRRRPPLAAEVRRKAPAAARPAIQP